MVATVKIAQWGNSMAVRLPKLITEQTDFCVGSSAEITVERGKLVISKAQPSLEQLVALVTPENKHSELIIDTCGGEML